MEENFEEFDSEEDEFVERKPKRKVKGYSNQSIENSKIDRDYCMHPISITYGVLTPCSSWDFRVKIGSIELDKKGMGQRLGELSRKTKRKYTMQIIQSEEGEEGEFDGLAVVGRNVEGEDIGADQSSHKLVRGSGLVLLLGESEQIIKDLKSIGFEGINKNDLYLHTKFYND